MAPVKELLNTSTVTLGEVFSNGKKYAVPPYQRDYTWKREHWEDLWDDILAVHREEEEVHYMGAVVFQIKDEDEYAIIDGQQRLVSLSLIVLAFFKKLSELIDSGHEKDENTERLKLLREDYIGRKDPSSLKYESKLTLNENCNNFYYSTLVQLKTPLRKNTLNASEKRLWEAFTFFCDKVAEFFKNEKDGEVISNLLRKTVARKLKFIQIVVQDELDAYTVFETLNSRGVELTATDLLKNYLLSLYQSDSDRRAAHEQWKTIADVITLRRFPAYLRHYWISTHEVVRQGQLYKVIRKEVACAEDAEKLLDSLEEKAELYKAFSSHTDDFWKEYSNSKSVPVSIRELVLFDVTQCYPLLLTCHEKFSRNEFERTLRLVSVLTFRYTVIGNKNANVLERVYNTASLKVESGEYETASDVFTTLKDVYPGDEEFVSDFSFKQLSVKRNAKCLRYILYRLEHAMGGSKYDYEEDAGTIEHVLPQSAEVAKDAFPDFSEEEHERFVHRLGNVTLLESKKNKECGNKTFEEKKGIYETSRYTLSKEMTQHSWTPETLNSRQEKLAKIAKGVWKFP